jgi:hypothetical protein
MRSPISAATLSGTAGTGTSATGIRISTAMASATAPAIGSPSPRASSKCARASTDLRRVNGTRPVAEIMGRVFAFVIAPAARMLRPLRRATQVTAASTACGKNSKAAASLSRKRASRDQLQLPLPIAVRRGHDSAVFGLHALRPRAFRCGIGALSAGAGFRSMIVEVADRGAIGARRVCVQYLLGGPARERRGVDR